MNWQIIIEIPAQTDLDEAFIWYEAQLTGLGYRFIHSFNVVIEKILRNPYFASVLLEDVRSASLSVFPYEVLYFISDPEQTVFVLSVGHQHRKPGWFAQRLQ